MKYTIKCSCGHERIVEIYGKSKDRESKIKYYESNECPECTIKLLKKQAKEKGLPELQGTEKQINWALSLREKHLELLKKAYYDSQQNPQYLPLIEFVSAQTEAKTFIDTEMGSLSPIKQYIELYKQEKTAC